mmetsp:Transcript_120890/g.341855  ORF Transcript_120890/g.341855 Transcript_120890/m.341855 type:complete len:135 (+) Transcript_120890:89-493(+)
MPADCSDERGDYDGVVFPNSAYPPQWQSLTAEGHGARRWPSGYHERLSCSHHEDADHCLSSLLSQSCASHVWPPSQFPSRLLALSGAEAASGHGEAEDGGGTTVLLGGGMTAALAFATPAAGPDNAEALLSGGW